VRLPRERPALALPSASSDLSMKVDNNGGAGLDLTFSSAGATLFSVKCLPVGETGSCTKE
jgi:hypothetical protein